jgi:hypothetical protein
MSVCPHETTHLSLKEFSWNLVLVLFRKSVKKFEFYLNMTRVTCTLNKNLCLFVIISRSALLIKRNFLHEICAKNQNTFYVQLFFSRKSWKNIVKPERQHTTTWRMRIVCWIPKATNAHSEYIIITIFFCNNGCTNAHKWYPVRHCLSFYLLESFQNIKTLSKFQSIYELQLCCDILLHSAHSPHLLIQKPPH